MESTVQVLESSLVAPSGATPATRLWLSPLDVAATRGYTPTVYLYRSGAAFLDVARLKDAMAKALVPFYPLAGRLGPDGGGRVEIACNSQGALFVAARSHLAAADVDFTRPSPELRKMLVPAVEPSSSSLVLAVQVTFFKCGAAALGVAVHHAAVDGTSTFHFLKTWSAFFRDGDAAAAAVELPCHDRTLLRARSPPAVHPDALSVLLPRVALSDSSSPPTATEVFAISGHQLAALKRISGGASTFCCVSALLWRCAIAARRLPPDATTRLSFPVNIRRRGLLRPPLPARYFGNALVSLAAAAAAREIVSSGALASVAGRIAGALARVDDEVVRSAIDYLELAGAGSGTGGVRPARGSLPETELRVVSWLGMPAYDADFGGGMPQVMSRADSVRGGFAHVINDRPPADHRGGGGGVRVVMCMEAANIDEFGRLLYANIREAKAASKH